MYETFPLPYSSNHLNDPENTTLEGAFFMKQGLCYCLMLCFGLTSLLIAQPVPQGRDGEDHGKCGPHRPPMVAPFGLAGRGPSSMQQPPIMMDVEELKALLNDLKVSKTTIEKVLDITRNFLSQLDGKLIKVQREELNIKEELLKEKPDLSAIQGYINKKTQIFAEIEFAQIKRDIDIKSLLSRDEYEALKSAMMSRMKHARPFADKAGEGMEGGKPAKPR
jgi:hypothetical protein